MKEAVLRFDGVSTTLAAAIQRAEELGCTVLHADVGDDGRQCLVRVAINRAVAVAVAFGVLRGQFSLLDI